MKIQNINPLTKDYERSINDSSGDFILEPPPGVGVLLTNRSSSDSKNRLIEKISSIPWVLAVLEDKRNTGPNGDLIYILVNKDSSLDKYYAGEEFDLLLDKLISVRYANPNDSIYYTGFLHFNDKRIETVPLDPFALECIAKAKSDYENYTLEDFEKFRVTNEKAVPETPAIIKIGGAKVAAAGNITPITAEAKAGKTAATSVFIAGAISKTGIIDGFNDVEVIPNPEGKAVVHFDTEQSEADQQYNISLILKRAELKKTPEYFLSYNIRTLPLDQYKAITGNICKAAAESFNGVHMIVIDGGADFINSVNDEPEANAIILFFTQLAVEHNCPVLLVVHLNENDGKNGNTVPRGHLGRQAVRKGYAQLNIVKDKDISVMQTLRARRAGSADTPLVAFKYDPGKGYHVSVDAALLKESKADNRSLIKLLKIQEAAERILAVTSYKHDDLRERIEKFRKIGPDQAKKDIKAMKTHEMVTVDENGYYRLNPDRERIKI